jgi:hypothetical protein
MQANSEQQDMSKISWNIWNSARQDFAFETTLSPEECIQRIQAMEHKALGLLNYAHRQVKIYNSKILGTCTFTITLWWRGKRGLYPSIELKGDIRIENGKTFVTGTSSELPFIAPLRLFLALVSTLFPLLIGCSWWFHLGQQHVSDSELACVWSFISVIALYAWSNIFVDRRNITKLIQLLKQNLQ